ncbi:hypothetical protein [Kistimonas asteriae]|nr:hypothetical protein [Kistimonas asteriae]
MNNGEVCVPEKRLPEKTGRFPAEMRPMSLSSAAVGGKITVGLMHKPE